MTEELQIYDTQADGPDGQTHVMLDLETMGTGPDAAVVSIGAITFDPTGHKQKTRAQFYEALHLETVVAGGGVMDPRTVLWWLRQGEQARKAITDPAYKFVGVKHALHDFSIYMQHLSRIGGRDNVFVWGNGSDFDNVILGRMFKRHGLNIPWLYRNNRCFRTLKAIGHSLGVEQPERKGTHHNALDDALHQAVWAENIFACINALKTGQEGQGDI